jgi:hypothetical protein
MSFSLVREEHERCGATGGVEQQQRRTPAQLSDESRLLYAEAFGSVNMGTRYTTDFSRSLSMRKVR